MILRTSATLAAVLALGGVYCVLRWPSHSVAQTTGLVAAYSFTEGTGSTVTDLSGNNLNGTIIGATWTTQGKYGNALSFNGSSNYVDLGNPAALQLTGSMTIEAWVNAAANPADDGQIVAKCDDATGWQLKTSPDTGPHTFGIAVSPSSGSRIQRYSDSRSLNTWYHVAGVYNASARTLDIYVNGALNNVKLAGTVPASQGNSSVNVNIGRRSGGSGYYFNGIIDEIRIYNRPLSPAEILNDMNTPLSATSPDTQPPTAPASFTAAAVSGTQVNLSWTAATDNVGVTGYQVERCQGAGCSSFAQIGSSAGTTYNDVTAVVGGTYNYRVRATDAANNLGPYANVGPVTTPAPDTQPPTTPATLTAAIISTSQINLSWTASTDNVAVAGYQVQRCQGAGCSTFTQIAAPAGSTYNDTGLSSGTSYSYRVQAVDTASNVSPFSNTASATTLSPPTAPGNLTAAAVSTSQINLSWTASTSSVGLANYIVQRCQGSGCSNFAQIAAPAGTTYNDTGLSSSTNYSYRIQTIDTALNPSPFSNIASATTQTALTGPTAPGNVTATAASASQIDLSWTASTSSLGIATYVVQRCQGAGCSSFGPIALLFSNGYTYRRSLTVDHTQVPNSDQSDFPVLVRLTNPSLRTVANGGKVQNANGYDIAFYSDQQGATPLVWELDSYDGVNGILAAWVKLPIVSHSVDTVFYLFYGNPSVGTFQSTPSGVWSNSFSGVWHLPNGTVLTGNDSTSNSNHASALNGSTATAGQIDGAAGFIHGQNQFIRLSEATGSAYSFGDVTLSGWFKDTINDTAVMWHQSGAPLLAVVVGDPAGQGASGHKLNVYWRSPTTAVIIVNGTTTADDGAWHHFAFTKSTASGTAIRLYVDGVLQAASSGTNEMLVTGGGGAHYIGGTASSNNLTGAADEIRIAGAVRTADWIAAEYSNQKANSAFLTLGSEVTSVPPLLGTTYSDTGLSSGTSYSYRVQAVDTAANVSPFSNVASATTLSPQTPPTAPGNVTAAAVSVSQVNLSWTASSSTVGLANYIVQRCQGAGCSNFAQIAAPAATTYSDTGLSSGTSYSYRVQAIDTASSLSPFSNTASATTQTPPTAPGNVTATPVSTSQINLSWTASTSSVGLANYAVERCQGTGCSTFVQIAAPAGTGTTYNDTTVAANTSYSYRVRATDTANNSGGYSNVASATTLAAVSSLTAGYSFNEGSGTSAADSSGHGITGSLQGATWTTSGRNGNALSFNGTSNYVDLGNPAALQITGSMTWSAWIFATGNPPDDGQIIAMSNDSTGWQFKTTPDTGVRTAAISISTSASSHTQRNSSTVLALNTWYHIAGVYNATARTLDIYVNGALVNGSLTGSSTIPAAQVLPSGVNANIGRRSGGFYFKGTIDDVRIYSTALTQAQIQADMNTPVGVVDTQAPTAPGNLTAAAASGTQINLSWTPSTDNVSVLGYMVERCSGTGCSVFSQIATPTGTTYNDTGLAAGASYSYRVRSTDAASNLSPYSNTATAVTPTPDTQLPTAPGILTANANGITQINLSWTAATDNVGVTGYLVERCQNAGCSNFAQIASLSGSTTGYNDTGLAGNTSYSYRVRATDAAANLGPYSDTASTSTLTDTQAPTIPANLTATATSTTQINLNWTPSTDNVAVTGYLVERCQSAGCTTFARLLTVPTNTFSDTGLAANTSYTYHVKATDAAGNFSDYSNLATTTTLSAVSNLTAAFGFNEGSGTTTGDASGNNGITGTLQGATWTAAGKYGNGLSFNGSTFVDLGNPTVLQMTGSMTLSAWVFANANPPDDGQIISKSGDSDGWQLKTTPDTGVRTFAIGISNGAASIQRNSQTVLSLNTWYHVAGVYNATAQTLDIYVNGVLDNGILASTVPPSQNNSGVNVNIGERTGGFFFRGTIDEVRVYNAAITQAQIQSDMGSAVGTAGPVPIVTLSRNSVSFGNQTTGGASPAQQVTVTNTGTADLAISGITVSGANSGDFAQTNDCGATLASNAACTISATFTPLTTGARTASIIISDNAASGQQTVTLTGTGTGFAIRPRVTALTPTQTLQFTAPNGVTWSVDGIPNGSAASGTISDSGLYTPPANPGTHTVTGTSADQLQSASATVYITNYPGTFTFHNDNLRTGQNLNETVLTPLNVNQAQFGKLFSLPLDGLTYASPLYVASVNIPGKGLHNVVYAATEHNSVYAYDADTPGGTPLWKVSFLSPGVTTVPAADTGECCDIPNEIGITGTPVIDQTTGTLYVVAKTKEGANNYVQRLHALDIATGTEKFGGPVVLQASVPGTGDGAVGGNVPFSALRENQRPGLALSNGVVLIGFAAHGDQHPWHGWVLGYNATTLQQVFAYNATPNTYGGGIWQSGGALAVDAGGNLYFTTGNGAFNANTGDYSDTVLKLSASGTVVDYFTPHDQANMESNNFDLSSAGPVVLLDQPGTHPHLLVSAAKTGTIYVIDRDNMGHFNASSDSQIVQFVVNAFPHGAQEAGNYSAPVVFNNYVYFCAVDDVLRAFRFTSGVLSTSPTSTSFSNYPNRGGVMAISANGANNGILWAIQNNDPSAGILRAYDANNLNTEFYNSSQAGTRDALDVAAKFTIPLVANGKVFVVSNTQLTVYGLLP
jgi:fibronectin type 3 domain-containing protein